MIVMYKIQSVAEGLWKSRWRIICSTIREGWGAEEGWPWVTGVGWKRKVKEQANIKINFLYFQLFSRSNLALKYLAVCEVSHQETRGIFSSFSWISFTSWDLLGETGHSESSELRSGVQGGLTETCCTACIHSAEGTVCKLAKVRVTMVPSK